MSENTSIQQKKKFSLIELLMIIMLVGIIFTFIVPYKQTRTYQKRVKEAIYNLQIIAHEDVNFYNDPANGYYAFDLSMLNMNDKLKILPEQDSLLFNYELTDSTVVAISTDGFGKAGAQIIYYLPSGPMLLSEDDLSRDTIDPNWLP